MRLRSLALAGILVGAALCRAAGPVPMARKAVILSGQDLLALPGVPVTLAAKLERDGFGEERAPEDGRIWRRDIPDRTLVFSYQGADLGSAVTDGDGIATVQWTPPGAGDLEVEVRFEGDDSFAPGAGSLLCGIRGTDRPAIVLDIDQTISTASKWDVIRGRLEPPPLPDSVEVVKLLAETHDIFYMTARINKFQAYTREWLAQHGFPRWPIFFMDFKKYPTYDEAQYKTDTLGPLVATFPNLHTGVGDKKSDAVAYRHHGLRALILGDTGGVQGAEPVESWLVVKDLLASLRARRFAQLQAGAP